MLEAESENESGGLAYWPLAMLDLEYAVIASEAGRYPLAM